MNSKANIELTKNGKTFLLLSSISVILGLAIDNFLFIIPGCFFWLIISSAFIYFLTNRNVEFGVSIKLSKEHVRNRGLIAIAAEITNTAEKPRLVRITLSYSYHFTCIDTPETLNIRIQPKESKKIHWLLLAARRGNGSVGPIEISLSPFQSIFINRRILGDIKSIKILPQRPRIYIPWKTKKDLLLKMVHEFAHRIRGRGDEFHSLREYQLGDQFKHIHWFATARQEKLISKEFEDQKNLHFLIFLDLGSNMFGPKFDYALSSVVELSSLIQGTQHDLAIIAYEEEVQRYIIPQVGKNELKLMLNLYDLEPTGIQSNFMRAVKFVKNQRLHHSVAIIFSDLEGEITQKLLGLHLLRSMESRIIFVNFSTMDFNLLSSSKWLQNQSIHKEYNQILGHVLPSLVKDEYKQREILVREILFTVGGDFVDVKGYDDNVILSLYRLMKKYSPTQRIIREAIRG